MAKGLKQSVWLAKTLAQCSTVPYTELADALCAVGGSVDWRLPEEQHCALMGFFHKDKCGAKLLAVANAALEDRATELARRKEVYALRKRALQVIGDSTKMTNAADVDWCDFLKTASCLAEEMDVLVNLAKDKR